MEGVAGGPATKNLQLATRNEREIDEYGTASYEDPGRVA